MNLKQMRKRHNLTQQDFYSRIGITQSGGCRYEQESRSIPQPVQLLAAIVYGNKTEKNRAARRLGLRLA